MGLQGAVCLQQAGCALHDMWVLPWVQELMGTSRLTEHPLGCLGSCVVPGCFQMS